MVADAASSDRAHLRIGLVHWAFPPTTGGVESHVVDLARLLAESGCAVTVITGEPAPIRVPNVDIVTTPLLNLDGIRTGNMRAGSYMDNLYDFLSGVVTGCGLSVIHGHNLHHFAAEPALAVEELRRRLGVRVHHTFHETWPDMLHDTPVYRNWDGNYAVSAFVQEECATRIGFRPTLLPLGADTEWFTTSRTCLTGQGPWVILHPARLLPWKGVHISVQMLALLRKRDVPAKLVLTDTQRIADWNQELVAYRKEICRLTASLGLEDRVEFRSAAYTDMPALYEAADVVIYPTVGQEPYGLVPLEAMSCRRPIVATRSGGIAETIMDGVTGFVVERGDANALADRVALLLADRDLARQLGEAGRAHIVRRFDFMRYVETLVGNYSRRSSENVA